MTEPQRQALRRLVRFMYDAQQLRIQSEGRGKRKAEHAAVVLDADDVQVLDGLGDGLTKLEADALKEVEQRVKAEPIGRWLLAQRGIGSTLAGVFLTEIDIRRAETVSALWKFAGLDVVAGHAPRMAKGSKRPWNGFLKTKCVGVAGDCILKACIRLAPPTKEKEKWIKVAWEAPSKEEERAGVQETTALHERASLDESPGGAERAGGPETPVGRERLVTRYVTDRATLYAAYRWRLLHRRGPCMVCRAGKQESSSDTERASARESSEECERAVPTESPGECERAVPTESPGRCERADQQETPKNSKRAAAHESPASPERRCFNCGGTGVGPHGRGSAHRHRMAVRYMIKMLLRDLWLAWREAEGLPVRPPYAVEKLGARSHVQCA